MNNLRAGAGSQKQHTRQRVEDLETGSEPEDAGSEPDETGSSTSEEEPPRKSYKIPKFKYPKSKAQLEQYRRDFENLADHADEFFHAHSMAELMKLDDKLGGGKKGHHKLTERLARNLDRSTLPCSITFQSLL
jgi:hypothetical protein